MLHASRPHVQAADQDQKPAQRAQRKYVNNPCALQPCVGNKVSQGQRKQQTAERRSYGVRELEDRATPRDRVHEMYLWNEVRNERGACRAGKCPPSSDEK